MSDHPTEKNTTQELAAPPTALPDDHAFVKIGGALERVSAVPEGQALVSFLGEYEYTLQLNDLPRGVHAQCSGSDRHIYFNAKSSQDQIAAFLPHEAFHSVQYENVSLLTNFVGCFQSAESAVLKPSNDGVIELLRPDEYHYAANLMEMAAYAVQIDVVTKMEERAGDKMAANSMRDSQGKLKEAYDTIRAFDNARTLEIGTGHELARASEDLMEMFPRDVIATNFLARYWFWAARRALDGGYARLHYTDGHIEFLHEQALSPKAHFNTLGAKGHKFSFRHLTDEEVRAFGQGCGYDVFGAVEFDDVRQADYRDAITNENRAEVKKMQAVLGLA